MIKFIFAISCLLISCGGADPETQPEPTENSVEEEQEKRELPPHEEEMEEGYPCTDTIELNGRLVLVPIRCGDPGLPWDPEISQKVQ